MDPFSRSAVSPARLTWVTQLEGLKDASDRLIVDAIARSKARRLGPPIVTAALPPGLVKDAGTVAPIASPVSRDATVNDAGPARRHVCLLIHAEAKPARPLEPRLAHAAFA